MTLKEWEQIGSKFGTTSSKKCVLFPALDELMPDIQGKSVLDVGCGDGFGVRWYTARGAICIGGDIVEDSINACRLADPEGQYVVLDARDIRLEGTFDYVLSLLVLMTLSSKADITAALQSMGSKLNERGKLIIAVTHPCFEHLNENIQDYSRHTPPGYSYTDSGAPLRYSHKSQEIEFTDSHWMIEDYARCCREAGLTISDIREPLPLPASKAANPQVFEARKRFPTFLLLVASRAG